MPTKRGREALILKARAASYMMFICGGGFVLPDYDWLLFLRHFSILYVDMCVSASRHVLNLASPTLNTGPSAC